MNCSEVRERLDGWLDDTLDPAVGSEVRAHLESCEACRREETEALELSARVAALPREVEPDRDLWPGIRDRIAVAPSSAPRTGRRIGWWAAAAAAVLAVVALFVLRPDDPTSGTNVAEADAALGPESAAILASYDELEVEFRRARESLLAELEAREESLDPDTVRVVVENLRLMEEAAAEIRIALGENPDNPNLQRMLMASYRKQVGLLQKANRIPSRLEL